MAFNYIELEKRFKALIREISYVEIMYSALTGGRELVEVWPGVMTAPKILEGWR